MGILPAFRHSRQGGTAMSEPPYRALRIVLGFLSLLLALGGLLLIFSSRGLILRVFMHPPESEISTLLLAAVKEMGGIVLTLSVMLFLAARDPERNVAIIDGMTLGLCILAITPLVSLYTLDIRRLYPGYLIWVRSLVRLVLAGVLYCLRPRETQWKPADISEELRRVDSMPREAKLFASSSGSVVRGYLKFRANITPVGYAMRERLVNGWSRRLLARSVCYGISRKIGPGHEVR